MAILRIDKRHIETSNDVRAKTNDLVDAKLQSNYNQMNFKIIIFFLIKKIVSRYQALFDKIIKINISSMISSNRDSKCNILKIRSFI
jgi:hypothetical protein